MRGKITVVVLLVGSVLFYGWGFWFLYIQASPDLRFNINRQAVPATLEDIRLLPAQVGDFKLTTGPTQTGSGLTAGYAPADGTPFRFSVTPFVDNQSALAMLNTGGSGCKTTPHAEAKIPYVYNECQGKQGFTWINGRYRFDAETSDLELALRFVNTYPY